MASNIPIKLTGDNKSALAAITGVQTGLTKLGSGVDNLNKKMGAFTNALVGVGIIAFTKSLLGSADQLQDMSDALGINTARLLEMGVAASASGSSMDGLNTMLFKMEANIAAAVEGNGEMQKALTKVGISLNDVNNLKPDQIFNKIAVALSKITDPLERTRLQTELFSKASKGFSAASYVAEIEKLYGTMDKYTQSTADAARISDSLGMFITLVKAEFLALLQPILNLVIPMTKTGDAMAGAAIAAKALTAALALFIGAQIINAINSVVGGLKSLASFMKLSTLATTEHTRASLLNAGAQSFMSSAIARVGTAEAALFVAQQKLNQSIKAGIVDEAILTKLRDNEAKATLNLKIANDALAASAGKAGIALKANGAQSVAVTGTFGILANITRTLGANVVGLANGILKLLPILTLGLIPAGIALSVSFGGVIAALGIIAVAVGAGIIIWRAFGDVFKDIAKTIYDSVVSAFMEVDDFLTGFANKIRAMRGLPPIELRVKTPSGNIGSTETPANAPSLLTGQAGVGSGGFISKEQNAAKAALGASLLTMQQQADAAEKKNTLTKHGTEYAKLQLDIDKAIGAAEADALKAGLDKSAVDKEGIKSALKREALANTMGDLNDLDLKSQNEQYLLSIKDTAEREIQAELMRVKQQYGSLLNISQLENYETTLRETASLREQETILAGIAQLRGVRQKGQKATAESALAGAALAQTPSDKLQADYNRQKQLLDDAVQYKIDANGKTLIDEDEYMVALQKLQLEQYNAELDLVIAGFDAKAALKEKEIQAEAAKYAEMLILQKDFLGQQRFTAEEAKAIALEKVRVEQQSDLKRTQSAIQAGADMFNALGAQNKKAFEVAKAFNIANAIMNTYLAATKALAQGGIFGFIGMAAAIAAGFAQVAAIRSQTYSGKALGGPMVGGQGYLVGEKGPEIFTPSTAGTMTPNDKLGGGATNVTFNIVANDTRGFDQLLMERRPLITKIIADAQLEKGRRQ
jgi:hypothetical protein